MLGKRRAVAIKTGSIRGKVRRHNIRHSHCKENLVQACLEQAFATKLFGVVQSLDEMPSQNRFIVKLDRYDD